MLSDHDDARVTLSRAATRISEHYILLFAGGTTPSREGPTIRAVSRCLSRERRERQRTLATTRGLYALYALAHTRIHTRTRNGGQTRGERSGKPGKNIRYFRVRNGRSLCQNHMFTRTVSWFLPRKEREMKRSARRTRSSNCRVTAATTLPGLPIPQPPPARVRVH